MNKILYVDMDEVLTDFVGGCCDLFGVDTVELHRRRIELQRWDIPSIISDMLEDPSIRKGKFYEKINDKGVDFWENLLPTRQCYDVMELMKQVNCQWYILSSPFNHWSCYVGKIKWIEAHLGEKVKNYIIHPFKHLHAREGTMLVDDRLENLINFESQGGITHLFGTSPMADSFSMSEPVESLRIFLEKNDVLS